VLASSATPKDSRERGEEAARLFDGAVCAIRFDADLAAALIAENKSNTLVRAFADETRADNRRTDVARRFR
jgi:hypothetical protein